MVAVVDVWNKALALARARTRVTVGDNSESAYQCGLFYDEVRRMVLGAHHWNCARKKVRLKPDLTFTTGSDFSADFSGDFGATNPPSPWMYSFKPPADLVTVLGMTGGASPQLTLPLFPVAGQPMPPQMNYVPYERAFDPAGGYEVLCCNVQYPVLVYTFDSQSPDNWHPLLLVAIVSALAGRLAQTMSGDLNLAKLRLQDANGAITEARVVDANESATDIVDNVPDWIQARGIASFEPTSFFPPYGPLFVVP